MLNDVVLVITLCILFGLVSPSNVKDKFADEGVDTLHVAMKNFLETSWNPFSPFLGAKEGELYEQLFDKRISYYLLL